LADTGHGGHHGHDGHDGHNDDDAAAAHGTFKSYMTGFVLAAILTAIPFWLVMDRVIDSSRVTGLVILAFAVVQIVVHIVYFLH
ncbi:cytochrome C oxidase subunit IV family protein, partial [Paenibacillus polymyxa]|nr:cytochrome C oxidase subunit IV family protein [Paenibacillus polymyxa]